MEQQRGLSQTSLDGFRKKGTKSSVTVSGTKPSIYNNLLLISCGVPSLDALIGGGVPVGSCILIDEDKSRTYSSLLLKYFIAEGIITKQSIFISSADESPADILLDLPQPNNQATVTVQHSNIEDDLTIAWRYKEMPADQSTSQTTAFGNYYDITKVMSKEQVMEADSETFDAAACQGSYDALLEKIQGKISSGGFGTSSDVLQRKVLRIGIASLGSPYWCKNDSVSLCRFLYALRATLRTSFASCMITMPGYLLQDMEKVVGFSDMAIKLDAFADSPETHSKNPAFKEYHGLVKLCKLSSLNSLVCHIPVTMDWVFKLKRKKLTIEKMHLPPELSETVSRAQEDVLPSCGQTKSGVKIDF